MPVDSYSRFVSENYRLYQQKMAQQRVARGVYPLRRQLLEIFEVVRACEARWSSDNSR